MPRIDDASTLKNKPFRKKSYRPWNLLDEGQPTLKHEGIGLNQPLIESANKLTTNGQQMGNKATTKLLPLKQPKIKVATNRQLNRQQK